MKHYPNVILRNIMLFSTMVYSKPAYRPTSPHSSNQQIHAYKNSNVNKICIADITSLAQWRFKDCFCLIHHFHIAHVHLPSCLAPPPPLPFPQWNWKQRVVVNKVYYRNNSSFVLIQREIFSSRCRMPVFLGSYSKRKSKILLMH